LGCERRRRRAPPRCGRRRWPRRKPARLGVHRVSAPAIDRHRARCGRSAARAAADPSAIVLIPGWRYRRKQLAAASDGGSAATWARRAARRVYQSAAVP
jgi:hypothetical protein